MKATVKHRKHINKGNIPVKVTKNNNNFLSKRIEAYFKESIAKRNILKLLNITSAFNKGARTPKINDRQVTILPVFFKTFEKILLLPFCRVKIKTFEMVASKKIATKKKK